MKKLVFLFALVVLVGCSTKEPQHSLEQRVAAFRDSGQITEAIWAVRNEIMAKPDDAGLRRLVGVLHLEAREWALAEIALKKALELGAADSMIPLEISEAVFRQHKFEETIDLLVELRYVSNKTEFAGQIRLAKALDETGDTTRAKRVFATVLDKLGRGSLAHEDAIDVAAIVQELASKRGDFAALDEVFTHRDRLATLPTGEWVLLHKQRVSDATFFSRQIHGGSAFDTKRSQLILFGSDTHDFGDIGGKNWKNNLFFFDPAINEWSRSYARDPVETYTVNPEGIPVAGSAADHPWAMHTYAAVSYDTAMDQLIVSSYPQHLEPGRFTYMLQKIWPKIKRHPTWVYDLEARKWTPLAAPAESFFQNATAYDSDRSVIVGYREDGIFELSGSPRSWRKVVNTGLMAPDNNMVYDSKHKALIIFGKNGYSNDIVVYEPATGRHEVMPTRGARPPKDRHVPMAFHAGIGKSVLLIQRRKGKDRLSGTTETWLYDLGEDSWEQVETAGLNFGVYRNYNLEYDPFHKLLLFVPNQHGVFSLTQVLALRL